MTRVIRKNIRRTKELDRWRLAAPIDDVIKYFQEVKKLHGSKATVDLEQEYEYGDPVIRLTVSYPDKETADEAETRVRREALQAERQKQRDLRELERLQRKYKEQQ